MSKSNLTNPARPCRLIHPMFGALDFRSLTHAAGWLGKEVLHEYYGRTDMGIDYKVLAFLLNHKIVLQSQDNNFPLNGLKVEEGFSLKTINKPTNQATQEPINKINQITQEPNNQAINKLIRSSGNDPLSWEEQRPKLTKNSLLDKYKNVHLLD